MNSNEKKMKSCVPVLMFVVAAIVFLAGVAVVVFDIISYNNTVSQYVSQGIPAATVSAYIIPQMMPEFLQCLLFVGIAFALFGIGMAYRKISMYALAIEDVFEGECECEECAEGEETAAITEGEETAEITEGEVVSDGGETAGTAAPAVPEETAEGDK